MKIIFKSDHTRWEIKMQKKNKENLYYELSDDFSVTSIRMKL